MPTIGTMEACDVPHSHLTRRRTLPVRSDLQEYRMPAITTRIATTAARTITIRGEDLVDELTERHSRTEMIASGEHPVSRT